MLFTPKSMKFKKLQKGSFSNKLKNKWNLNIKTLTSIKLVSCSHGRLNVKQLTAIRFLIRKSIKKRGFIRFNVFPQKSISKKPSEIRMGKGKGNFFCWVADIKTGIIVCEIFVKSNFKRKILKLLKRAQIRLPIKTKIKTLY